MTGNKLPDFSSCLKFMIAARKHLLYFYRKQGSDDAANADIDVERQANILKSLVERSYMHEGVSCYVLKSIPQEGLPTYADQTYMALEIVIVPQVHTLSREEQNTLVRMMVASQQSRPTRLFIGMISWDVDRERKMNGDVEAALSSRITLEDWLKHKFWLACYEPFENELVSPMRESTPEPLKNIRYTEVHANRSIHRYILDVMIHLRMHRLVDTTKGGGVHTGSSADVLELSQMIAIYKYKRQFVTPDHVKQACIWYFPMHLELLTSSLMDTSVMYGSKPELVDGLLSRIAEVKLKESVELENPLFLETLVVRDVLKKVVPPV
ncbi:MTC2 (YKL098W) [Zygosaccharomyces parabailii]|uniref:ZYBA0S03-04478g1_1 n=1 Tax=Zygosaccharomyces bailii (strain CLIB 213 / ATCC 58445 / CBS 680 / BCRC 21525 / NBRC 1098 / NCYC 1416 / NRRL Y-2227) TaxID=1333698 RepID=A0A8J2T6B4_ZYGB2|nr:MTC2 (YKL098W) [Zygosaccharomyces parabailii]CDF88897.1 ZYBA0S03-04478g1_1 [Zygosaccharomyces bailii CLIB 213]CDH15983.1 probable Maintenance of telomere capping protein 2 [Zygosaccharomyces bailii ISA1307]